MFDVSNAHLLQGRNLGCDLRHINNVTCLYFFRSNLMSAYTRIITLISEKDFYSNNFEAIRKWSENNDPNVWLGRATPLGLASFEGKIKTVKMLVKNGASPNFASKNSWTPLIFASNDCRVNVIKYLISIGADVNAVDNKGQTALHHLCFSHRKDNTVAAYQLIEAGIDIDAKNLEGKRASDLAKENKDFIPNYNIFLDMITT